MEEEWRNIAEMPNYMVSNLGQVKSLKKGMENILKQFTHYKGYRYLFLYKEGVRYKFFVHRLVARAFIPNPLIKPIVNHLDSCRHNNIRSNLEWATDTENQQHRWMMVEKNQILSDGTQF